MEMAEFLKAPPELFWERWTDLFKESILGIFPTPEAKVEHICGELGVRVSSSAVLKAAQLRYRYEADTMIPRPEAEPVLRELKARKLKIGLISDCSAEATVEWPRTSLANLFDVVVFSCQVGMKKPDPRIYRKALQGLDVPAVYGLYLGDGSSHELSGAEAVGLTPVMLKVPDEGHPDVYRVDQEEWPGESISGLKEIFKYLE
jgi:putative hydrolase of the HAD superfamily